jgi:hypothetical protein
MFQKSLKKNAKMIGLSEDEFDEFLSRYQFFLLKNLDKKVVKAISKRKLNNGFFILENILQKREKKKKDNLKYATKNPLILKYRDEIVSLYTGEKYGEKTISNMMRVNHKASISSNKIRYFLKKNNLLRKIKKEDEMEELEHQWGFVDGIYAH